MHVPKTPAAALFVVGFAALVLSLPGRPAAADDVKSMPPEALLATLKDKQDEVVVLDVRTREEYEGGHVPGALHIPYDELESRVDEVRAREADRIVVYCESGGRAARAESTLQEAGFTEVYDLEGHMKAWREAKRPTKRPLPGASPGAP